MSATITQDKVKIGLAQINNSFSGASYFPYAVGMLQTYAQKHAEHPERYEFHIPVYRRENVETAVEKLLGNDIVGFSTYVWNVRLSLEIARRIKERRPETTIIFGGPQVPDRAEQFMLDYRFIDIGVHAEGEQVFLKILESYPNVDLENIPSISWVDESGTFRTNPKLDRLKDLEEIPSPYLEGVFDHLMEADPEAEWLALWETNRGCPFSCTFCDWGSATVAKVNRFDIERLYKEVDWFSNKKIEFIFCCDANFGILPRDMDIANYVADIKEKTGYPRALSVQNTKNRVERAYEVQKKLATSGLNKGVTLSLQSVDEQTLTDIRRQNISSESYEILQKRFTEDRIETYSDVILALPGETYETFTKGVSTIINQGQHNRIQFNNLSILPNAEMGDPEYQKKYGMKMVESRIINIHGSLTDREEFDEAIQEMQELVIGTDAMPEPDWVRVRVFSWMMALLHFNKVFQIPMVITNAVSGLPWHEIVELFTEGDLGQYPNLRRIREFLVATAEDIQQGGPEYVPSREWLNIYWPADEYILIELIATEKLGRFYQEAGELILDYLEKEHLDVPKKIIEDAISLNFGLMKLPFQTEDLEVHTSYNIWEYYRSLLVKGSVQLVEQDTRYHIDRTTETWNSWDHYCKEVIWYGNKKGAYLYTNKNLEMQLAGHF